MNHEALDTAIDILRDKGLLKDICGIFTLELVETYLDQSHDEETIRDVPTLFCEIVIQLLEDGVC